MPRNLEIKARLADRDAARREVEALGARHAATEEQIDRYYQIDGGRRVKLRVRRPGGAELIDYDRPETAGVRASDYRVTPVRADDACLVPGGKPLVVVRKTREVHLLDNVRIHLDRVEELGEFLELEAVVDADHDEADCRRRIEEITRALGVAEGDLIRGSYADLLRRTT